MSPRDLLTLYHHHYEQTRALRNKSNKIPKDDPIHTLLKAEQFRHSELVGLQSDTGGSGAPNPEERAGGTAVPEDCSPLLRTPEGFEDDPLMRAYFLYEFIDDAMARIERGYFPEIMLSVVVSQMKQAAEEAKLLSNGTLDLMEFVLEVEEKIAMPPVFDPDAPRPSKILFDECRCGRKKPSYQPRCARCHRELVEKKKAWRKP